MPQRWLHELIDLCTLGQSFWLVHREKDRASQFLGSDHREVRHGEAGGWAAGLFKKVGRKLPHKTPEEFYKSLRKIPAEQFLTSSIFRRILPKLPPEANAAIQHEAVDHIWSEKSGEEKKQCVKKVLETLFEGKPLWDQGSLLPPKENEDFKKAQQFVNKILREKGIEGLL